MTCRSRPGKSEACTPVRDTRNSPAEAGTGLGVALLHFLELFKHCIQPKAVDELHHVVGQTVLLADAEHGDDVGVVELGGRLRFALEAPLGPDIEQHAPGQHLQGHVPSQRNLLGLVDDAHAAFADLAQDAIIPELQQGGGRRRGWVLVRFLVVFLDLLDLDHGREQLADVVGQLGIAVDIILERRSFAGPIPGGELVSEPSQQDVAGGTIRGLVRHCRVLRAWWRGSP